MLPRVLSFLFGAFCLSLLATKFILLAIHAPTVPAGEFLLFFPTFFVPDLLAIGGARLLLRTGKSWLSVVGAIIGTLLALIVIGAASSQLGFYYETGGELEWREASTFAQDKEALKVLLSGSTTVVIFGCAILFSAFCTHTLLYRVAGDALVGLASAFVSACRWILDRYDCCDTETVSQHDGSDYGYPDSGEHDRDSVHSRTDASFDGSLASDRHLLGDVEKADQRTSSPRLRTKLRSPCIPSLSRFTKNVAAAFVALALAFRPPVPYDHMSVTLPFALIETVHHPRPLNCFEKSRMAFKNPWPLPKLLEEENWELPEGHFKGWAPHPRSELATKYRNTVPSWLVEDMPHGFQRWDPIYRDPEHPHHPPPPHGHRPPPHHGHRGPPRGPHDPHGHHGRPPPPPPPEDECPAQDILGSFYNPVEDPLKISNLGNDPMPQLEDALKSVKIKNVVFILMEALRSELFPIKKDSAFYNVIADAHDEDERADLDKKLTQLTPNVDRITGGIGGFQDFDNESTSESDGESSWRERAKPGHGGINVIGASTASTLSTKSFAANLCGTWPMTVKNFDEAESESYQPCFPQLLSLLNKDKEANETDDQDSEEGSEDDFLNYPWRTALFESMTETFDRQDKFDRKLGWDRIIAQKELKKDRTRYKVKDPMYQRLGYLGFAEPVLEPYLKDFISESTTNKERMFMMHFTSITHHPWELPDWFNTTEYIPGRGHKDLNKYLNTIRYHDYWMGELMRIFEETGIADETLVVFAGDHGQAFTEDTKKQGTYENGHVSNFRIPITFRHPQLPRVQYEANASSISILPTILDLLVNTGSLNERDSDITSDILHDYEGQSLLRPYKPVHNGRRAWNFAVVNSGADILGISSADAPWRMVLPLTEKFEFKLSDMTTDPGEKDVVSAWSLSGLVSSVKSKYGGEAAEWAVEAEAVAQWWMLERKRLWRHS